LRFQVDLQLQALRMPLDDLARRGRIFDEAVTGFVAQRRIVADLLAADRERTLGALDREAERVRAKLGAALEEQIDRRATAGRAVNEIWTEIQGELPDRFQRELEEAIQTMRTDLDATFEAHQKRATDLVDMVQRTAAELLDVPFRLAATEQNFEAKFLPYWVVSRPDALNPLPPGALDALLPPKVRARHARRRTSSAIAEVTMRNVENLRWAMRRNVEDAFRRFASEVDARFAVSLATTREVMSTAASRRTNYSTEIGVDIDQLQSMSIELNDVEDALA
jgi:hypothetical protein